MKTYVNLEYNVLSHMATVQQWQTLVAERKADDSDFAEVLLWGWNMLSHCTILEMYCHEITRLHTLGMWQRKLCFVLQADINMP
jgi:hypothetical protein